MTSFQRALASPFVETTPNGGELPQYQYQLWNCTHFRRPTDDQLQPSDIHEGLNGSDQRQRAKYITDCRQNGEKITDQRQKNLKLRFTDNRQWSKILTDNRQINEILTDNRHVDPPIHTLIHVRICSGNYHLYIVFPLGRNLYSKQNIFTTFSDEQQSQQDHRKQPHDAPHDRRTGRNHARFCSQE